jgi:hypothetical protein
MFKTKEKTTSTILMTAVGVITVTMLTATRRIWVPFIYEYIYPRRDPCQELDAGLFRHPDCPGGNEDFLTRIIQVLLSRPTP